MLVKQLIGKALVNIVKTEIVLEDDSATTYSWTTASEAGLAPNINEGKEDVLRVKNQILATNRTEDILVGFDLTFKDNVFIPEIFALIDGGIATFDEVETDKLVKYEAPLAGSIVDRKLFTVNVYTEEKDIDGNASGYVKFIFRHCKGKPVTYDIKDGEFMSPEVKMVSRPKFGESPVTLEFMDAIA